MGNRRLDRGIGKGLIGWWRPREQGRANELDAGQVWREKQAGEECRNTDGKHRENRKPKAQKTQYNHAPTS